ncbi:hypothetical protein BCY84_04802 [Trypanosoma cruzi cruzi]|uniref:Uncharacterized protein n=1 Tax=Trypanosoma cruzi TaxID=5693 RepID=A0A2V2UXE0_TRYCR|nr:hypothetical protein TcBrA4_0089400 [Trypanosoma cruzi]PBJ78321.1 hypothetical protein BCY84_04802 [Trypanosoma cruzi cruzi]PWU88641.1 hypothetical protein C4B63_70g65 [Trypanosoma cruzi]
MNGQETGERGWLEHYLDLSADEDARSDGGKQSCFVTSEELFERLQEEPSLDEQTVGVHVYTEPEVSWAPFSLFSGNHHFLVIETSSWWWSIELRDGRIVVQRGKDFSSVQNRCRCRYRRRRFLQNGPCLVFQGTFEWCCLRDLFFFIDCEGFFNGGVLSDKFSSLALVNYIFKECGVRQLVGTSHV